MKAPRMTYSVLDEMMASTTRPLPEAIRTHQLTRMWQGLRAIETSPDPTLDDWRVCSDAVNLLETLVVMGVVEDGSGLLRAAIEALAAAGKRHCAGGNIRLDAKGIQSVRAALEDYATVLETVPARVMVRCHRQTEKRIREILSGKRKPHDVEVISL